MWPLKISLHYNLTMSNSSFIQSVLLTQMINCTSKLRHNFYSVYTNLLRIQQCSNKNENKQVVTLSDYSGEPHYVTFPEHFLLHLCHFKDSFENASSKRIKQIFSEPIRSRLYSEMKEKPEKMVRAERNTRAQRDSNILINNHSSVIQVIQTSICLLRHKTCLFTEMRNLII